MKPVDFDYAAPKTIGEVLALLDLWGNKAKILAGGQSLMPLLVARTVRPEFIIDINRIPDLDFMRDRPGGVAIGATVRQSDAERSELLRSKCPLLVEALSWVAVPQVRNMGTVIGSLAQRNAISEIPTVAVATGARLSLIDAAQGERTVDAETFFDPGHPQTLNPKEMVTEAYFPEQTAETAWAFLETQRRQAHYALVGVAVIFQYDENGMIHDPRIAASGISNRPVRLRSIEQALVGKLPSDELFTEASKLALHDSAMKPFTDIHASAEYRREVTPVIVDRALRKALGRARRPS